MLYMIIERYKDKEAVYSRFAEPVITSGEMREKTARQAAQEPATL